MSNWLGVVVRRLHELENPVRRKNPEETVREDELVKWEREARALAIRIVELEAKNMELHGQCSAMAATVKRIWVALGIEKYEQVGGKEISMLVAVLRAKHDRLLAALRDRMLDLVLRDEPTGLVQKWSCECTGHLGTWSEGEPEKHEANCLAALGAAK